MFSRRTRLNLTWREVVAWEEMGVRRTSRRTWRVGELAEATGLTVRTLHHYEQIGLLAPARRTEGQQRLYDEHDVRRLYRIRALRDLGLSLGEVLRAHLARVDAEIGRLGRLRVLLDRACTQAGRLAEPDDVLAAIEAMSRVARHIDARGTEDRAPGEVEARWRALGAELREHMEAEEAPSSPRARAAARAVRAELLAFAGGDRATLDALACLRRLDPPENLAGWDPELMGYLDRALAALDETEVQEC